MNARSLLKNRDEMEELVVRTKNPGIIALSETRLTNETDNCEIMIPDYKIVRCDSERRTTGGTMMYIKKDIEYEIIVNENTVNICWTVGIRMKYIGFNGVIHIADYISLT